jgi:hypothetical protein
MTQAEKIAQKIKLQVANSPVPEDPQHSLDTRRWVLRLDPKADMALQIAALAHDIDRGVSRITDNKMKQDDYARYKQEHALRSAQNIKQILEDEGCDKEFVDHVFNIVKNHETGGDPESDLLRNADSISYFDTMICGYYGRYGKEKTQKKIIFMYNRTSPEIQKIIKGLDYPNSEIRELVAEA